MLSRVVPFVLGVVVAAGIAIGYVEREVIADTVSSWADQLTSGGKPASELSIAMLERRAAREDMEAVSELARRYGEGDGVEPDPERVVLYTRQLAEADDTAAMRAMAGFLFRGEGVEADGEAAVGWLERAAEAGDVEAQVELGERFY
jgi:TPR repeat protein